MDVGLLLKALLVFALMIAVILLKRASRSSTQARRKQAGLRAKSRPDRSS